MLDLLCLSPIPPIWLSYCLSSILFSIMLPSPFTSQSPNLWYSFPFLVLSKQFPEFYWEHKKAHAFWSMLLFPLIVLIQRLSFWLFSFTFLSSCYVILNKIRLRYMAEIYVILISTSVYLSRNKKVIPFPICYIHNFPFIPSSVIRLLCDTFLLPALKLENYLMCSTFSQISSV